MVYFLSVKVVLILANSEDPDEISFMLHFIWVFTVCGSTHLGFTSRQRVKYFLFNSVSHFVQLSESHFCRNYGRQFSFNSYDFRAVFSRCLLGPPKNVCFRLHEILK